MTRPHTRQIVITVWAITRESWITEGHYSHLLIGHWGLIKPSHWSLLTATNWAWNLLEQNTTSHFLITSSFSHVVIAKKLISLLTKQRNISVKSTLFSFTIIAQRLLSKIFQQHLFFKLVSSSHSNNKISRGKIQFKLSILVLCQLSKLETQHRWQSGVHFSC